MSAQTLYPSSLFELKKVIESESGTAVYFSTERCTVCHALLPKMETLFAENFPQIKFIHVEMHKLPDASAHFSVFNAPTLLVFFEGKESYRKSSNMGIGEVFESLRRPYKLLFS